MTVEFDEAVYLANQVEDARQRAVLASADAEQAKLDAQAAEYAARESANKGADIILQANQAVLDAQTAAAQAQAPTDEMVADLAMNPASLTRGGIDSATGSMITEDGSATQAAGDARWVTNESVDGKITELIEDPSGTSSAIDSRISTQVSPIATALTEASDPLAFLDHMKLICKFPVRENGEVSWPQGFSINKQANELYVSNQNGTELRIDIRDLTTGIRKSARTFTTENGAFTESLDWFYSGNDICFVVWPKAGGGTPSAYAIANYTQGTMGPQIPIYGFSRGCRDGSDFITSDAWTTTVTRFYIYDWESVKAGSPTLLNTVKVSNPGATAAKNQGLAAVSGAMFLPQGSQVQNPTITAYHSDGRLADIRTFSRESFMEAVNRMSPGTLNNPAYLYECEGAASLDGRLVTGQIVNGNPSVTADGVMLIIQHGRVDGVRAAAGRSSMKLVGDWVDVPLEAGWAHVSGNGLQARLKDGNVEFRGFGQNSTFTGGYTKVGVLPDGIPAPERDCVFHISGNTTAIRSVYISQTREIRFYTSAATASWYSMSEARYGM